MTNNPHAQQLDSLHGDCNIDGYGDEGAGYDFDKYLLLLLHAGWTPPVETPPERGLMTALTQSCPRCGTPGSNLECPATVNITVDLESGDYNTDDGGWSYHPETTAVLTCTAHPNDRQCGTPIAELNLQDTLAFAEQLIANHIAATLKQQQVTALIEQLPEHFTKVSRDTLLSDLIPQSVIDHL